jgi:hypothetical protein
LEFETYLDVSTGKIDYPKSKLNLYDYKAKHPSILERSDELQNMFTLFLPQEQFMHLCQDVVIVWVHCTARNISSFELLWGSVHDLSQCVEKIVLPQPLKDLTLSICLELPGSLRRTQGRGSDKSQLGVYALNEAVQLRAYLVCGVRLPSARV